MAQTNYSEFVESTELMTKVVNIMKELCRVQELDFYNRSFALTSYLFLKSKRFLIEFEHFPDGK